MKAKREITRCMMTAVAAGLMLATTSQADAKPLKVFILAGQSNMEGPASVKTFDYIGDDPATAPLFKQMRDEDGKPRVCDHAWISYLTGAGEKNFEITGKLTAGYGSMLGLDSKNPGDKTGLVKFRFERPAEERPAPYVTPDDAASCWKKPGPAAGPFQARLGDGSVVTYYWYRFADQPAMLNADFTPEEREVMQKRVEMLHRAWTKDRNYLAPPDVGTLASLDPALILAPPRGMEAGYVPIATRQELAGAASRPHDQGTAR